MRISSFKSKITELKFSITFVVCAHIDSRVTRLMKTKYKMYDVHGRLLNTRNKKKKKEKKRRKDLEITQSEEIGIVKITH